MKLFSRGRGGRRKEGGEAAIENKYARGEKVSNRSKVSACIEHNSVAGWGRRQ